MGTEDERKERKRLLIFETHPHVTSLLRLDSGVLTRLRMRSTPWPGTKDGNRFLSPINLFPWFPRSGVDLLPKDWSKSDYFRLTQPNQGGLRLGCGYWGPVQQINPPSPLCLRTRMGIEDWVHDIVSSGPQLQKEIVCDTPRRNTDHSNPRTRDQPLFGRTGKGFFPSGPSKFYGTHWGLRPYRLDGGSGS